MLKPHGFVVSTALLFSLRSYIVFISFIINSFIRLLYKSREERGALLDNGWKVQQDYRVGSLEFVLFPRDSALSSSDFALPTNDFVLPTNDSALPTNDSALPSNDSALPTNDSALPTNDSALPTNGFALSSGDSALPTNGREGTTDIIRD